MVTDPYVMRYLITLINFFNSRCKLTLLFRPNLWLTDKAVVLKAGLEQMNNFLI
jgi:hypothetical protein